MQKEKKSINEAKKKKKKKIPEEQLNCVQEVTIQVSYKKY